MLVGKCLKKVYEKFLRIFEVYYCDGNLFFLWVDYVELFVDVEEEEGFEVWCFVVMLCGELFRKL